MYLFRRFFGMMLVVTLLFAGCSQTDKEISQEIVLEENQTMVYGKVTQAIGNEFEIALGTMEQRSERSSKRNTNGDSQDAIPDSTNQTEATLPANNTGEIDKASAEGTDDGSGRKEALNSTKGMVTDPAESETVSMDNSDSGSRKNVSIPMGDPSEDQTMPSDAPKEMGQQGQDGASEEPGERMGGGMTQNQIKLTGETISLTIAVGTPVTRVMGTSTRTLDFTSISVDSTIGMVMEEKEDGTQQLMSVQILG